MKLVPRDRWFDSDHFWNELVGSDFFNSRDGFFEPRVDIIDKDDSYLFVAELPGVAKDDIDVDLEGGVLTIQAKIAEQHQSDVDNVLRKERRSGFFSRSINVGKSIQADQISAELVNGLLMLRAPKVQLEEAEKHKIKIR
ncbi:MULTISPECIES: Hsp20/alpha crystallin family protein [unclassified Agarivorans]|uniref:Hsp20/alpha crystallin family protein n=1 Tax=unclassified Agarivorans TaxID=2636026 RepID=UPI003D7EB46B